MKLYNNNNLKAKLLKNSKLNLVIIEIKLKILK